MAGSLIVAGARTPIGKLSGALASLTAMELGGIAIKAALERAGISGDQVDHVLMGDVIMAGQGQNPARQAGVKGGVPMTVPALTLNRACLSGLNAIHLADLMIQAGDADIVVAGGMESMSKAPFVLPGQRDGFRYGNAEIYDAILLDGLTCAFEACQMGEGTDRFAAAAGIPRERQDEFAARSHERAAAAIKDGRFEAEIVPVPVPQRKGDPVLVEVDEGVRPGTTVETLAKLRPAFTNPGTITAGNASQLSDGASAVVVASRAAVERLGLQPLGEIVGHGQVAGPDTSLLTQPSRAINRALERSGLSLGALDLIEINEAFAAVALASIDDLGVSPDIVNVNGGAVALGHPVGMSGNRVALTLLHELRRRGGGTGVASLCGAGGMGEAMILRTL